MLRFLALLLQRSWDCDTIYGCNVTKPSVSMVWEQDSKPNAENGDKTPLSPPRPPFVSFPKHLSTFLLFQAGGLVYPSPAKFQPCLGGAVWERCRRFQRSLPRRSCSPLAPFCHMGRAVLSGLPSATANSPFAPPDRFEHLCNAFHKYWINMLNNNRANKHLGARQFCEIEGLLFHLTEKCAAVWSFWLWARHCSSAHDFQDVLL